MNLINNRSPFLAMKKIFLILFSMFTLSLPACNRDDVPISFKELPAEAQKFVNKYFSDINISVVLKDDNEYEVKFANGYQIEFNKKGEWKEVDCQSDEVPAGIVPENIRKYVAQHYPQNFIVKISLDSHGYDVELNNDLDLEFDRNGNFLRIDD